MKNPKMKLKHAIAASKKRYLIIKHDKTNMIQLPISRLQATRAFVNYLEDEPWGVVGKVALFYDEYRLIGELDGEGNLFLETT
jgi:hypothetical protein